MRRWLLGALIGIGMGTPARAQSPKPWAFEVQKKGRAVGRYDCNIVADPQGIFAVAASYDGPKALKSPRPGSPAVRCHAELDPRGALGKYKRWKNVGKGGALYWFAFVVDGEVRLRHEGVGNAKPKVTSLGRGEAVRPLEEDQPVLAWVLVRDRHEGEFLCVGSRSQGIGKGIVRKASGEGIEATEAWEVSGDCGSFRVEVGPDGNPQRFVAGDTVWKRMAPAP
ncbi:MAG TPA: hypothetical protein PLQ97_14630 [Myxococcota bacterium]|nr:hypothetical protein [Myxococcota bacterium]HQK51925.1 hypothetical protein [Myxococcota bacterium]